MDYIKPPGQLELSEKELKEEWTKELKADNPVAPDNICSFTHTEKKWEKKRVEQTITNFVLDGYLLHPKSDEARKQKDEFDEERDAYNKAKEAKKAAGEEDDGELR